MKRLSVLEMLRERDAMRSELERVKKERDALRRSLGRCEVHSHLACITLAQPTPHPEDAALSALALSAAL
ncbi:MAG: hypothetical protein RLZZ244_1683 [Verrucomicrobiota bacterium]|jgi:hypothetical protein